MSRYRSSYFSSFGKGLNLLEKPDAVDPAECIDSMNVLFGERGALEPRPGYADFTPELAARVNSLSPFYTTAGDKQLLVSAGQFLAGFTDKGALIKSKAELNESPFSFGRFGKPDAEVAYAGNGTDTLRKWNGKEWTAPTATIEDEEKGLEAGKDMPRGAYLAAWPDASNRLVVAGFKTLTGGPNGFASSPSHVYLSNPGDPETYTETAYEQLTPGDGEAIQGVIQWRELVFVFKETKFFVFYGESTDAEGFPEFNFRSVEAGVGLASPRALCADATGVYFLSRNGVYRTTGQEPECISTAIDPIFRGSPSSFYLGGVLDGASIDLCAMCAYGERIYVSFPTTGQVPDEVANDRTLVYDPAFKWWALTDIPAAAMTVFRPEGEEELLFAYASGDKKVGRHHIGLSDDVGKAIVERWRSGWSDLGSPDIKKVRATKMWAAQDSEFFMGVDADFRVGVGTVTRHIFEEPDPTEWDKSEWGEGEWSAPHGLLQDERRVAARGTVFSVALENSQLDKHLSLHRLEHLVSQVRDPAKDKG